MHPLEDNLKKIILLRHFTAQNGQFGIPDKDRILTSKSQKECEWFYSHVAPYLPPIDLVLCSTAKRTFQTLSHIIHIISSHARIIYDDYLYLASRDQLIETVQLMNDDYKHILVIAHNPGLSYLVQSLNNKVMHAFPTGSVAVLQSSVEEWQDVHMRTLHLESVYIPTVVFDQSA